MKKSIILILTLIFFSSSLSVQAGSVLIIVNKNVPAATLSADELTRIFLGKKTMWNDSQKIVPICLKGGQSHETFLREYLDMNPSQFDIYWKKAVFTGTGRPPKSFETETEVEKIVRNTPGGIGYINSVTQHGMLKILNVR